MIVVAYGLLLPQAVLDAPRLGCINVHGSLLPRWRGAAPIQRAIWAGDLQTGVTIMQMDIGLDTGPILLTRACPIASDETSASLYDKLAGLGPTALLEAVDGLLAGRLTAVAQDDTQANYAQKLSKEEARLDWQQPACCSGARHPRLQSLAHQPLSLAGNTSSRYGRRRCCPTRTSNPAP